MIITLLNMAIIFNLSLTFTFCYKQTNTYFMQVVLEILKDNKQRLKPLGFFALTVLGLYGLSQVFKVKDQEEQEQQNPRGKRPAGIMNEGNTCFVNSLLQALSSAQTFRNNIESLLKVKVPSDDNEELIIELSKVIKKINKGSQNISVMDLLDILSRTQSGLINFQQQDTYELYSAIVKGFDEFFNKRKQCNLSVSQLVLKEQDIVNCLIGYTKSTIQCMTCKKTMTIKVQSYYDLSLEIAPGLVNDINTALIWHQRKQKIQCYACTFCSVKAHLEKLQRIQGGLKGNKWEKELTEVCEKLTVFLKKNSFEDMDLKQINQALQKVVYEYKDIFDMIGSSQIRDQVFSIIKPVQRTIAKQTKITKYPNFLVIHFKQLVINPYSGEPMYMKKPIVYDLTLNIEQKTHTKIYKLTSLLTHIGNENMGHYFTFRRISKDSDEWFLISDTHTEKVSEQRMRRHVPYMLFYELDEENYDKNVLAKSLREDELYEERNSVQSFNLLEEETCTGPDIEPQNNKQNAQKKLQNESYPMSKKQQEKVQKQQEYDDTGETKVSKSMQIQIQ